MSDLLLKINNLSLAIDNKQILSNINLSASEGKIITIIGPNGSGKSTLVNCIIKLIEPNQDNIWQGDIWLKPGIRIGYMPQKLSLNATLPITVLDFLKLKIMYQFNDDLLQQIIHEVGIKKILSFPLQKISGGEMQRTLLARALLMKPHLLILDEPTQGVDINGQAEFYQLIDKLRVEKKITSIIISHDLHVVMSKTDHVVCLNHHICCEGSPSFVNKQADFQRLFYNKHFVNFSVYEHHHDHNHN